jgi:transcriptional regulator with XRE-family HTH domain
MTRAQELAKRIKQTRKSLGLNGDSGQQLLKKIREAFGLSNEELAECLGVSLDTLLAYLAPETAKKHRKLPEADRLVLARILAESGTRKPRS